MKEKSNLSYATRRITTTNRTTKRTHERTSERIKKLRGQVHYKRNYF